MLLGSSAQAKLYPSISSRLSGIVVSGIVESRYVSDSHIQSCLYIEMYAFNCVSFEKLWSDKLLRFQWQTNTDLAFNFCGPGLSSISPWHFRRRNMCINVNKKMKALSK